jgi:hypothetical protein
VIYRGGWPLRTGLTLDRQGQPIRQSEFQPRIRGERVELEGERVSLPMAGRPAPPPDLRGVQPRYGQKPPPVDHGVSFYCSDEVSAVVIKAAVEAEHREAVPT